ncbi:MAG TPA: hypothetical protein VIW45_21920, partial [Vicinamibacterales bacterium]
RLDAALEKPAPYVLWNVASELVVGARELPRRVKASWTPRKLRRPDGRCALSAFDVHAIRVQRIGAGRRLRGRAWGPGPGRDRQKAIQ